MKNNIYQLLTAEALQLCVSSMSTIAGVVISYDAFIQLQLQFSTQK
ncbi:unnamed protein product [Amoebophrya sp. A25]|nr:unnamed protein product [Amoebophrya sp. A25]|eukprot:GSA25T00008465001.1